MAENFMHEVANIKLVLILEISVSKFLQIDICIYRNKRYKTITKVQNN
jgi:hypothetical protein